MTRAKTTERTDPLHARGDYVEVSEIGIRPWRGIVTAVKFSPVSGWWVEVRRGDDGTYALTEDLATQVVRMEEAS